MDQIYIRLIHYLALGVQVVEIIIPTGI